MQAEKNNEYINQTLASLHGRQEAPITPVTNKTGQENFDALHSKLLHGMKHRETNCHPSPCSRVFILQGTSHFPFSSCSSERQRHLVLLFARISLLRDPPTYSWSLTSIASRRGCEWLHLARQACGDADFEVRGKGLLGGSIAESYWTNVSQLVGWWKNNICRKSRLDEFHNEADPFPNIEDVKCLEKRQRIRWSKCVLSVSQTIKHITSSLRELSSTLNDEIYDLSCGPDVELGAFLQNALSFTESLYESCHPRPTLISCSKPDKPVCPSSKESSLSTMYRKNELFVVKLFKVVSDDTIKCIRWLASDSFSIEDPLRFAREVLPDIFQLRFMQQFFLCMNLHGFLADIKEDYHTFSHPLFVEGRWDLLYTMANSTSNAEVWAVVEDFGKSLSDCAMLSDNDRDATMSSLPQVDSPMSNTTLSSTNTTQMYTSLYHALLQEGFSVTSAWKFVERLISLRQTSLPSLYECLDYFPPDEELTSPDESTTRAFTRWQKVYSPTQLVWSNVMESTFDARKDFSFQNALIRFNGGEDDDDDENISDRMSTEAVAASSPVPAKIEGRLKCQRVATKPPQRKPSQAKTKASHLAAGTPTNSSQFLIPVNSLMPVASSLKAIEADWPPGLSLLQGGAIMMREGSSCANGMLGQDREKQGKRSPPLGKRFQASIPSIIRPGSRRSASTSVESVALNDVPSKPFSTLFGLMWTPNIHPEIGKNDPPVEATRSPLSIDIVSAFQTILDVGKRRCSFIPHLLSEHSITHSRLQRGDVVIISNVSSEAKIDVSISAEELPPKRRRKRDESGTSSQTSTLSSCSENLPTSTTIASIVDISFDSQWPFQVFAGDDETFDVQASQIVSVIDNALPSSTPSPLTEEDICFLLHRNHGDVSATVCDVTSDWTDDSHGDPSSCPQRLPRWSPEEIRKLCQGYRRYGDDILTIRQQMFKTARPSSEILALFTILRPYLRQGLWQQICGVFRRAAQDRKA